MNVYFLCVLFHKRNWFCLNEQTNKQTIKERKEKKRNQNQKQIQINEYKTERNDNSN